MILENTSYDQSRLLSLAKHLREHAQCHKEVAQQDDKQRQWAEDLAAKARGMWPTAMETLATPTARDWKSGKASDKTMARNSRPLSEQIGGSLSPMWVEWLMAWPIGWSDLKPLEMDKCLYAPPRLGES